MKKGVIIHVFACVVFLSMASNALSQPPQGYQIDIGGGTFSLNSDNMAGKSGFHADAVLEKFVSNNTSLALAGGIAKQDFDPGGNTISTDFTYASLQTRYYPFPANGISPFAYLGAGGINFSLAGGPRYWDLLGSMGAGVDMALTPAFKLSLSAGYHLTTGDDFDGYVDNKKDSFVTLRAGLALNLSKNAGGYTDLSGQAATAEQVEYSVLEKKVDSEQADAAKRIEYLNSLRQRVKNLQQQLLSYEATKTELQNAIVSSDEMIKKLEQELMKRNRQ
ncbi:hypothetical protein A2V82_04255 [candidate division KSB1 bacterium RBG_16_48_16]|nr:MAG: hypothetical protein A2V82_04255 [candidate division KSB1 bacterium RBG_16_48_16]